MMLWEILFDASDFCFPSEKGEKSAKRRYQVMWKFITNINHKNKKWKHYLLLAKSQIPQITCLLFHFYRFGEAPQRILTNANTELWKSKERFVCLLQFIGEFLSIKFCFVRFMIAVNRKMAVWIQSALIF